jgi:hypothetical protein
MKFWDVCVITEIRPMILDRISVITQPSQNLLINFRFHPVIPSELEPQRELDLALAVRCFRDRSGRTGVLCWVGGIEHHIPRNRAVKVRMVEDVEGLCPELQIQSFF